MTFDVTEVKNDLIIRFLFKRTTLFMIKYLFMMLMFASERSRYRQVKAFVGGMCFRQSIIYYGAKISKQNNVHHPHHHHQVKPQSWLWSYLFTDTLTVVCNVIPAPVSDNISFSRPLLHCIFTSVILLFVKCIKLY